MSEEGAGCRDSAGYDVSGASCVAGADATDGSAKVGDDVDGKSESAASVGLACGRGRVESCLSGELYMFRD